MTNNFDLKKYLKEGRLFKENFQPLNLTPQQEQEFTERIKSLADEEDMDYAMRQAGNILARVLTNNEAEFIEDVEDFGYDPNEVESYAQNLLGNEDLKDVEVNDTNIEGVIQSYIKNGSKGDLFLNKYNNSTLPSNFPKIKQDLVLNDSSITSLPRNLSVGGTLFLYNTPISKKYSTEELKNMLPGVNRISM